jgi:MFS family permease
MAVFTCAFSSLLFASATVFSMAIFSRVLLGFCSATAFIGALKLTTVWFEPRKLALLVGTTQALGMVGAAMGARLVPYLNETIGWQTTFTLYAMVFFVLSILIFLVVRNHPKTQLPTGDKEDDVVENHPATSSQLLKVLSNKYTWINALYAGFIYAPTDAMGELWGRDFLEHIHQLSHKQASHAVSYLFIGWAVGGPLAGWLADHWGRRPVMILSAMMGFILLPILFYVPHLSVWVISVITFLYGITNTGLIACYTTAGELHDKSLGGFSMAIANMFSVLLGALLMPLLGFLLDWHAALRFTAIGTLDLSVQDYQRSTLILPLCLLVAIVCAFLSKETLQKKMAR